MILLVYQIKKLREVWKHQLFSFLKMDYSLLSVENHSWF